jgi:hypothetical protein
MAVAQHQLQSASVISSHHYDARDHVIVIVTVTSHDAALVSVTQASMST